MKNTITIRPTALIADAGDSIGKTRTLRCRGLRPGPEDSLVSLSPLSRISGPQGLRPLTSLHIDGDEATLFAAGRTLMMQYGGPLSADRPLVKLLYPVLPANAVCAAASGNTATLMLLSDEGVPSVMRIAFDGRPPKVLPDPSAYPALTISAVAAGNFSAVTPTRSIPADFLSSSALRRSDVDALSDDLCDAYTRCADAAAAAGAYLQPALARYRLVDARGHRLFESPPVLLSRDASAVSVPSGFIERSLSPEGLVGAHTLNIAAWRPRIAIPVGFASQAPEVAAVELIVSEQFHPFHPDAPATALAVRRGNDHVVRVSLPGASFGISPSSENASARRLAESCAAFDSMSRTVARIVLDPADDSARSLTASLSPGADIAASVRRMDAAIAASKPPTATDGPVWPDTLWGSSTASDASTLLWGGIARIRFGGYRLSSFSIARKADSGRWRGGVSVRFADGTERVVTAEEGSANAPTLLSPVLSYPSADAVEMRLQLTLDSLTFDSRYPLSPDPSGRMALYISPGFAPIDISQGEKKLFEVEDEVRAPGASAGAVAICRADEPLTAADIASIPSGAPVAAIAPALSGNQGWEFGRRRFVVATADALYSLAVSAAGHSLRRIYARGISRPDAMAAAGPHGVYALTSDATLLNISPAGTLKRVRREVAGPFLQYLPASGALACGGGEIIDIDAGCAFVHPSLAKMTEAFAACARPVGADADGLILPEEPEAADAAASSMPVDWLCRIDLRERRPSAIIFDFAATRADFFIDLRQDCLTAADEESPAVCVALVHGSIRGPLRLRLHGRRASFPRIRMRIHGRVSPDFVFRSFTLCYDN